MTLVDDYSCSYPYYGPPTGSTERRKTTMVASRPTSSSEHGTVIIFHISNTTYQYLIKN
mgnify:FL=1